MLYPVKSSLTQQRQALFYYRSEETDLERLNDSPKLTPLGRYRSRNPVLGWALPLGAEVTWLTLLLFIKLCTNIPFEKSQLLENSRDRLQHGRVNVCYSSLKYDFLLLMLTIFIFFQSFWLTIFAKGLYSKTYLFVILGSKILELEWM